jgi:hypothetical protein
MHFIHGGIYGTMDLETMLSRSRHPILHGLTLACAAAPFSFKINNLEGSSYQDLNAEITNDVSWIYSSCLRGYLVMSLLIDVMSITLCPDVRTLKTY